MNRMELLVVSPRSCPNCGAPVGRFNCDYDCPMCKKSFCSCCYKTDTGGPGNYVFCPGCNEKLFFPSTLTAKKHQRAY